MELEFAAIVPEQSPEMKIIVWRAKYCFFIQASVKYVIDYCVAELVFTGI
jgi:hypothetical protein